MRIVHISDCYAPRIGGIETQVAGLAGAQAARGNHVHVLTATAGEVGAGADSLAAGHGVSADRGESAEHGGSVGHDGFAGRGESAGPGRYRESVEFPAGVKVHRLATPITFGIPVHPRSYSLITKALKRLRPDVVHIHAGVVSPFAYDGARAARALGLATVITWHCMLDGAEPAFRFFSRLLRWQHAPLVASAVSSVAAERVRRALGRADVSVLPNGLDMAPWRHAARQRTNPGSGPLRVIATQRLAPRKRPLALVRAVMAAHEELGRTSEGTPRIRLLIAGGGSQTRAVREEIRGEGEDVVTLLGPMRRELLPTLYRDQDVFVAPAHLEAFGLAALEARAAGLAVIADRASGITDFVEDGVGGLLFSSDRELADRLVTLASAPERLRSIREHNCAVTPPYSWDDVTAKAAELYAKAN